MRRPENELRNLVISYLERSGFLVVWLANELMRNRFKNKKGLIPGLPDLIVLGKNIVFFIELKVGKNDLSFSQKVMIEELRRRGFEVFVVRSLEELENILKAYTP